MGRNFNYFARFYICRWRRRSTFDKSIFFSILHKRVCDLSLLYVARSINSSWLENNFPSVEYFMCVCLCKLYDSICRGLVSVFFFFCLLPTLVLYVDFIINQAWFEYINATKGVVHDGDLELVIRVVTWKVQCNEGKKWAWRKCLGKK